MPGRTAGDGYLKRYAVSVSEGATFREEPSDCFGDLGYQAAAADHEDEVEVLRREAATVEGILNGGKYRAGEPVFGFAGIEEFALKEGGQQFLELRGSERRRMELEGAAIKLAGMEARMLFDESCFVGIGVLAEAVQTIDFSAKADFESFGDGEVGGFDEVFLVLERQDVGFEAILLHDLGQEDIEDDGTVDVTAAQAVVTGDGEGRDLQVAGGVPAKLEYGDIAGATAEVEDE